MKMTSKTRNALPSKEFALPAKRKFPINDKAHAVAAERLVGRALKAGSITSAEAEKVKSKAKAKAAMGKDDENDNTTRTSNKMKSNLRQMNQGGWQHDESMAPFHHTKSTHSCNDR
jgi:hypothetical protein